MYAKMPITIHTNVINVGRIWTLLLNLSNLLMANHPLPQYTAELALDFFSSST